MHILFDHGTPRGIARSLHACTVKEAKEQGWDTVSNGDLLKAAEMLASMFCLPPTRIFPISRISRAAGWQS
jgi:hypothetical protein